MFIIYYFFVVSSWLSSINLDSDIGMFMGLAIGDALGAPLEFKPSREPENYIVKYITGGAHNVSKGEFTDDTSMALAMADAFIALRIFDAKMIMQNFLKWKNEGAYSPRGEMFDCGNAVFKALQAFEKDQENPFTGPQDEFKRKRRFNASCSCNYFCIFGGRSC